MKTRILFVAVCAATMFAYAEAESGTVECRGFGRVEFRCQDIGEGATRTAFTLATPELAVRMAAKRKADLLDYGDLKEVAPGVLHLDGTGSWTLEVSGKVFTETFDSKAAYRDVTPYQFETRNSQLLTRNYPAWMDCFDRYGMAVWLMGGGAGSRVPADFEWLRKMDLAMCPSCSGESAGFAPGEVDFTSFDWYERMARQYGIPWRLLSFPDEFGWCWNRDPLPHVTPMNGHYPLYTGMSYPNVSISGAGQGGCPGVASDRYRFDSRRRLAEHLKDSAVMGYHASEEQPRTPICWLAGIARTPSVVARYHEWLREVEHQTLASLGERYAGDAGRYRSWDEVSVPVMTDFLGSDTLPRLDILEGPWELSATKDGPWVKGRCDDIAILIHARAWSVPIAQRFDDFHMRRTFEVPAGADLASLRYLHLGQTLFNETASEPLLSEVWVNGRPCAAVPACRTKAGNWSECFDLAGALREGRNELLINAKGRPIQGYCFLNGQEMQVFLGTDDARLNRRWYDAMNFAAWLRTRYVEDRARAIRAGDPNRPIKAMAIHTAQDLMMDLCRRYGIYLHDTGLSGASFAPYRGSGLSHAHGLAYSCEQAGPPKDAQNVRSQVSFYLSYANDALDAVFAVAHYTEKDDVRAWCEENRELLHTIGRLRPADDETIAVLRSSRCERLGFSEFWNWDPGRGMLPGVGRSCAYLEVPDLRDRDLCAKYRVIWDCATELMEEADVRAIRDYAAHGGTFVAMHHTARHSPERPNAWPLAAAFGLTIRDKMLKRGEDIHRQPLGPITFAEGQDLFPALAGKTISGSGVAIDCTGAEHTGGVGLTGRANPVATWDDDGSMAVAEVKVGKGRIVFLGSPFLTRCRDERGAWMSVGDRDGLLDAFLARLGVPRVSSASDRRMMAFHRESKNGVYDVYTVTRMEREAARGETNDVRSVSFVRAGRPAQVRETGVIGHPAVDADWRDGRFHLPPAAYAPMQTRVYAVPRTDPGRAALRWIRNWAEIWHPVEKVPASAVAPVEKDPDVLVLREGWENGVAPASFGTLGWPEDTNAAFRIRVAIPERWKGRRVRLSGHCPRVFAGLGPKAWVTVNGRGLRGLDPFEGKGWGMESFERDVTDAANGGSVEIEIRVDGSFRRGAYCRPTGAGMTFALSALPKKLGEVVLETGWQACLDLDRKEPVRIGERKRHVYFETAFTVPSEARGHRLFLARTDETPLRGIILNNRLVNAPESELEITNLVDDGGENVLRWACDSYRGFSSQLANRPKPLAMADIPSDEPLPSLTIFWRR